MQNFDAALNDFLAQAQSISDRHMSANYDSLARPVLEIDSGSKFIRIVRTVHGDQRSAHCFVAQSDGYNKKLGAWSAGDVFKCDGWKGPARGRRGNIFDDQKGCGRMGPYGPEYNRG